MDLTRIPQSVKDLGYLHACDDVAAWCSPEQVEWFAIRGTHSVEDMNDVLRREQYPEDMVVREVVNKRGHWVGPEEAVESFGLHWHDAVDGCEWTHATTEWTG